MTFAVAALWHLALILNLRGLDTFAGLHFFWTVVLGLGPFVCLGQVALLADRFVRSGRPQARVAYAAITAGLSPWLFLPLAAWFGIN